MNYHSIHFNRTMITKRRVPRQAAPSIDNLLQNLISLFRSFVVSTLNILGRHFVVNSTLPRCSRSTLFASSHPGHVHLNTGRSDITLQLKRGSSWCFEGNLAKKRIVKLNAGFLMTKHDVNTVHRCWGGCLIQCFLICRYQLNLASSPITIVPMI